MKQVLISLASVMLCAVFATTGFAASEQVTLPKYPQIKVGFTSWNFSRQMPVNVANARKWVDYAADNGFAWMELRDPGASLSLADCKEIAAYARQRKVELVYAIAVGPLDGNFWETFSRAVANAGAFDGPRIVRTSLPGQEFATDPKKIAWTQAEFSRVVENINRAADTAKMFGLQHAVENSAEILKGDGANAFGTTEVFGAVNHNAGWQIDVANFFVNARVPVKAEDVRAFLDKYADRLIYAHIKTATPDNKPAPVLGNTNPLPFDAVFQAMAKSRTPYVAIEVPQPDSLDALYANMKKSVDYLRQNY
jgi:sugar phosphate isomerase/epimerase